MFGRIPLGSRLASDFCLLGDFLLVIQFLCWFWICSNFLFLRVSGLVVYMFLEFVCFFHIGHFLAYNFFIIFSYNCSSVVLAVISSFSFVTLFIWVLYIFFLINLARGFSILLILSMNKLLVLLICSTEFFCFCIIYFYSNIYHFPSAGFRINFLFIF